MAALPEMPPELRAEFPLPFWNWWQAIRSWLLAISARVDAIDGGGP